MNITPQNIEKFVWTNGTTTNGRFLDYQEYRFKLTKKIYIVVQKLILISKSRAPLKTHF